MNKSFISFLLHVKRNENIYYQIQSFIKARLLEMQKNTIVFMTVCCLQRNHSALYQLNSGQTKTHVRDLRNHGIYILKFNFFVLQTNLVQTYQQGFGLNFFLAHDYF